MASKSAMSLMMQAPKRKSAPAKADVVSAPAGSFTQPPPVSHADMLKDDMEYSKRSATRRWVEGDISTAKHNQTHARANKVLKGMKRGH